MSPILDSIGSVKGYGWGSFSLPSSFESIATITPSNGTTSITFSSIPQTYKSLQIRAIVKDTVTTGTTTNSIRVSPFGNYQHTITANATTVSAANISAAPSYIYNAMIDSSAGKTNMFGAFILDIIDYSSTTKNKTAKYIAGNDSNGTFTYSGISLGSMARYATTEITTLTFSRNETAFATGTTFALYGVK